MSRRGWAVPVIVVGLVVTAGVPALAQEKPFDVIRAARVHGVVIAPQTRFKLDTIKRTLIGLPGAAGRAGDDVLERYGVPDPALRLREGFLAGLGQSHAAEIRLAPDVQRDDDPRSLQKAFGDGFVLDFRTRIWRIMFSPGKKHHKIEYWGRARLVRLGDPKVLWDETCKFMGDAPKDQGTEEDMLANDAALLKATLILAADHCVTDLSARFGGR